MPNWSRLTADLRQAPRLPGLPFPPGHCRRGHRISRAPAPEADRWHRSCRLGNRTVTQPQVGKVPANRHAHQRDHQPSRGPPLALCSPPAPRAARSGRPRPGQARQPGRPGLRQIGAGARNGARVSARSRGSPPRPHEEMHPPCTEPALMVLPPLLTQPPSV